MPANIAFSCGILGGTALNPPTSQMGDHTLPWSFALSCVSRTITHLRTVCTAGTFPQKMVHTHAICRLQPHCRSVLQGFPELRPSLSMVSLRFCEAHQLNPLTKSKATKPAISSDASIHCNFFDESDLSVIGLKLMLFFCCSAQG